MRMARYLRLVLLFLLTLLCHLTLQGQTIRVLVLDALNGKPQEGVKVNYFCQYRYRNELPPKSVTTNSEGFADVPYTCGVDAKIEIGVYAPLPKEQCGELGALTYDEISATGIVSNPSADGGIWCPKKISKKLKPVPGQLVIFVKKPTWHQSHIAG